MSEGTDDVGSEARALTEAALRWARGALQSLDPDGTRLAAGTGCEVCPLCRAVRQVREADEATVARWGSVVAGAASTLAGVLRTAHGSSPTSGGPTSRPAHQPDTPPADVERITLDD